MMNEAALLSDQLGPRIERVLFFRLLGDRLQASSRACLSEMACSGCLGVGTKGINSCMLPSLLASDETGHVIAQRQRGITPKLLGAQVSYYQSQGLQPYR